MAQTAEQLRPTPLWIVNKLLSAQNSDNTRPCTALYCIVQYCTVCAVHKKKTSCVSVITNSQSWAVATATATSWTRLKANFVGLPCHTKWLDLGLRCSIVWLKKLVNIVQYTFFFCKWTNKLKPIPESEYIVLHNYKLQNFEAFSWYLKLLVFTQHVFHKATFLV